MCSRAVCLLNCVPCVRLSCVAWLAACQWQWTYLQLYREGKIANYYGGNLGLDLAHSCQLQIAQHGALCSVCASTPKAVFCGPVAWRPRYPIIS